MRSAGLSRDTQQENSYTKYAVTKGPPVTAMRGGMNEASRRNEWDKFFQRTTWHGYAVCLEGEMNELCRLE